MSSFNNAVSETLKQKKYDYLMGRAVDFKKAAADFLLKLLRMLPTDDVGYNADIILAVFAAVCVIIIAVVTWYLFSRRKKRKLAVVFDGVDLSGGFADILAKSDAFAADGHLREAERYRYLALLIRFAEAGIINIYDAKTNGQLIRDVRANSPVCGGDFSGLTDMFDYSWFGHKDIGVGHYDAFCETFDRLMTEVRNEENEKPR